MSHEQKGSALHYCLFFLIYGVCWVKLWALWEIHCILYFGCRCPLSFYSCLKTVLTPIIPHSVTFQTVSCNSLKRKLRLKGMSYAKQTPLSLVLESLSRVVLIEIWLSYPKLCTFKLQFSVFSMSWSLTNYQLISGYFHYLQKEPPLTWAVTPYSCLSPASGHH